MGGERVDVDLSGEVRREDRGTGLIREGLESVGAARDAEHVPSARPQGAHRGGPDPRARSRHDRAPRGACFGVRHLSNLPAVMRTYVTPRVRSVARLRRRT
ncbi:hypothetical protein GCM10009746_26010 [Microbacterium paludicola]